MIHEVFPTGPLQCNCSVIGDETTREAIVVDPGGKLDDVDEVLKRHRLKVSAIVITHAHIDHIGGAAKLREISGAPIYMNRNDFALRDQIETQALWLGLHPPDKPEVDGTVGDGDTIPLAEHRFEVRHTPGHTQGSICLFLPLEKRLIAGDTLFRDSIGRTDLPGGNSKQIIASIKDKILTLDDDVVVIPGHGPETTIGRERAMNFFLQGI